MEVYFKSEQHLANCKNAKVKAVEALQDKKLERIKKYLETPKQCLHCKKVLGYESRKKKFCNSSCAAKETNKLKAGKKRNFSEEGLKNIANAIKERVFFKFTKIHYFNCEICKKLFVTKNCIRKTCSEDCKTVLIFKGRKYQNGHKHYTNYFNKWLNKNVVLESSWEIKIAEQLDLLNIKWERPKFIKWNDGSKDRIYFPDFYLNDFNVYLDPKNPFCMSKDKLKMEIVSKKINLVFGDIKIIEEFLNRVVC